MSDDPSEFDPFPGPEPLRDLYEIDPTDDKTPIDLPQQAPSPHMEVTR